MRVLSRPLMLIFSAALLSLCGCASAPAQQMSGLQVGMDKDLVLQKVGDPKRTFRSNSQDHWIYVYFKEDGEWRQQIDFIDGKVSKVGRPIAKKNWVNDLENAESMEEFESKARAHQKKAGDFKPIDGQ